jgi:hypothetical protein
MNAIRPEAVTNRFDLPFGLNFCRRAGYPVVYSEV